MPQIIRYDRAWIPLYKHNPSRFGWFFRVVPAHQFLVLGFSELDKPFKGGVGRNRASHTPPVAILSISAIYADVIFAKCFCSFLNRFHFLVSFWIKLFFLSHAPAGKQQIHASKHAHSSQNASIAFSRIRSSAACSASSAARSATCSVTYPVYGYPNPFSDRYFSAFSLFMAKYCNFSVTPTSCAWWRSGLYTLCIPPSARDYSLRPRQFFGNASAIRKWCSVCSLFE